MQIDLSDIEKTMNPTFRPLLMCKDRYLILWGGGDSGKSRFAGPKLIVRGIVGASKKIEHNILVMRKTMPAVRQSAFKLMQDRIPEFNLQKFCKAIKNPMEMTLLETIKYMFMGMDDPEKVKSIERITTIWLEEVTEFTVEDFRQLDLRLRGFTDDYMQIVMTFNPIDEQHWIKKEFFDDHEGMTDVTPESWPDHMQRKKFTTEVDGVEYSNHATLHHSTYKDNKFVTPQEIAVLEGLRYKDENYYKIYCLGQWGVLKGIIYENYEVINKWPDHDKFDADAHGYGLDFGYTNDPSALIEVGFIGNDLYMREHLYERKLTNPEIAMRIATSIHDRNDLVCADCAEPKSIEEIHREGFNIWPCEKGKDSIVNGIQAVKQYNLKVYAKSVNLQKELCVYKWAEDKNGNMLNKPVDFMNHLLDPLRYIVKKLKGGIKPSFGVYSIDQTGKDERKEKLQAETYDPIYDDDLWKDL